MKKLSIEQIISIHNDIIDATGGSKGIRDFDLLESAINKSEFSFDGIDLYPDVISKISAIVYSIINNHAFIDRNKRIGVSSLWMLLKINKLNITYTEQELIDLGLSIANSLINQEELINWITKHIVG